MPPIEASLVTANPVPAAPNVAAPLNVDAPPTVNVLEALTFPATCKPAATLEDAEEMKPPVKLDKPVIPKVPPTVALFVTARPVPAPPNVAVLLNVAPPPTVNVELAERFPATWRPAPIEEDALAINPFVNVESPVKPVVPVKNELPPTVNVLEALKLPAT